jgi:hypothetical protein
MFRRFQQWYWDRQERKSLTDPVCAALKRAVERVGKEFERRPYDQLLEPAEKLSFSRVVDGIEMHFAAEAFTVNENGDIGFCIDAHTGSKRNGWQPSYQFFKRKDGTVYY